MNIHAQDAPKNGATLFDLLGRNEKYASDDPENGYTLRQAFKTAGSLFSVFDDDGDSVIVSYGNGQAIAEKLIAEDRKRPLNYTALRELTQEAKPYMVTLRRYEIEELRKKGTLTESFDGSILILTNGFYDEKTGFSMKADLNKII